MKRTILCLVVLSLVLLSACGDDYQSKYADDVDADLEVIYEQHNREIKGLAGTDDLFEGDWSWPEE